jgi:lipid-A-disaccharide synthase
MATVMIVSGESSGELYGSLLAKALKTQGTDLNIIGIGGERMSAQGVTLIARTTDAFGLLEAVSAYRTVRATFKKAVDALKKFMPDVLVLIDYPDFNIRLARVAKHLRIKTLYYVSPQVWAWRKGRVKKIADIVDRMAVLFPFEEEIYKKAGVDCEFVGHPISEEIEDVLKNVDKDSFKAALGLDSDRPLLSLLPGSRPHELKRLLPVMTAVVRRFKSDPEIYSRENYQFCVPLAQNTDEGKYQSHIEALRQEGVLITKGETVKILAVSDMAVVCSGTATLQTVFLEVPMVVVYRLSLLSYLIGKLIIKVTYISLVNILSGRETVRELLQDKANPETITRELKTIMFDAKHKEEMLHYYRLTKEPFMDKRASERVAEIIMEMTQKRN